MIHNNLSHRPPLAYSLWAGLCRPCPHRHPRRSSVHHPSSPHELNILALLLLVLVVGDLLVLLGGVGRHLGRIGQLRVQVRRQVRGKRRGLKRCQVRRKIVTHLSLSTACPRRCPRRTPAWAPRTCRWIGSLSMMTSLWYK